MFKCEGKKKKNSSETFQKFVTEPTDSLLLLLTKDEITVREDGKNIVSILIGKTDKIQISVDQWL